MSILRPYQRQAIEAFWQALSEDVNRVAIQMATGLGKTVTFAGAIVEWMDRCEDEGLPLERALILVERDELVHQAEEKALFMAGGKRTVGVVQGPRNEVFADIIVASVATLRQPGRMELIAGVGFIVVDECHHAVAPTYQRILEHFGAFRHEGVPSDMCLYRDDQCESGACCRTRSTGIPVLGVTATPARGDGQGLGSVWQDLAFSRSLDWGIRKGYLIDFIPYTIKVPDVDMSTDTKLDTTLAEGIAPEAVVQAWLDKVWSGIRANWTGVPSTVLFAPLVRSAQAFADAFNAAGIKAEVVHGAMPAAERKAVLDRYEAGVTTVLCNAMVLTEGWDSPRTMCIIVARPTRSTPLLIQMIGRGARPWLAAEAPAREDQRCILFFLDPATADLDMVADLREAGVPLDEGRPASEVMEDEWDIGKGIEDEPELYRGPVRVERWDKLVQASVKAWNHTDGGTPFLPTAKRSQGYVFLVEREDGWDIWAREPSRPVGRASTARVTQYHVVKVGTAPDLELAMALAEDEAQERGGPGVGALLADRTRAWRKGVPSEDMQRHAASLGLDRELAKIMAQKSSGKAGRLSDLISRTEATRVLDRTVAKIKARNVVPPA